METARASIASLRSNSRLQATLARLNRCFDIGSTLLSQGVPSRAFRFNGGIGDSLLCSTVARELRKRGEGGTCILSSYPELFSHNADVHSSLPDSRLSRRLLARLKVPTADLTYGAHTPDGRQILPPHHILVDMCRRASIRGAIDVRPYIALTPEEKRSGVVARRPQIAIQSSGTSARYPMRTKEWFPDRFQQIVRALGGEFSFVQVGAATDPVLDGALDLRGKTTIRQTAAVLAHSIVFVGLVGFLMHLARAVDCRSVIAYGGREWPSISGYTCNENLVRRPQCSPCGLYDGCEYQRACMDEISVEEALAAIRRQLDRWGTPLPIDTALS
jgi:hypothetical protein